MPDIVALTKAPFLTLPPKKERTKDIGDNIIKNGIVKEAKFREKNSIN